MYFKAISNILGDNKQDIGYNVTNSPPMVRQVYIDNIVPSHTSYLSLLTHFHLGKSGGGYSFVIHHFEHRRIVIVLT